MGGFGQDSPWIYCSFPCLLPHLLLLLLDRPLHFREILIAVFILFLLFLLVLERGVRVEKLIGLLALLVGLEEEPRGVFVGVRLRLLLFPEGETGALPPFLLIGGE